MRPVAPGTPGPRIPIRRETEDGSEARRMSGAAAVARMLKPKLDPFTVTFEGIAEELARSFPSCPYTAAEVAAHLGEYEQLCWRVVQRAEQER